MADILRSVEEEIIPVETEPREKLVVFVDSAKEFVKIEDPMIAEIKDIGKKYEGATGEKLEPKVTEAVVEKVAKDKKLVVKSSELLDRTNKKYEKTREKYEQEARHERRNESAKIAWDNLSKEEHKKILEETGIADFKLRDFKKYLEGELSEINGNLEDGQMISEDAFYEALRENKLDDIKKINSFDLSDIQNSAESRISAAGFLKLLQLVKKGKEALKQEKNTCRREIINEAVIKIEEKLKNEPVAFPEATEYPSVSLYSKEQLDQFLKNAEEFKLTTPEPFEMPAIEPEVEAVETAEQIAKRELGEAKILSGTLQAGSQPETNQTPKDFVEPITSPSQGVLNEIANAIEASAIQKPKRTLLDRIFGRNK